MASIDTLGERFGLDPDTIDALNTRYGEPVNAAAPDPGDEQAWYAAGAKPNPVVGANNPNADPRTVQQQEAQSDYDRMVKQGVNPEKARALAGVETKPGEITVPRPPDDTATQGPVQRAGPGINPEDSGQVGASAGVGGSVGGGRPYVGWIPGSRTMQEHKGYSEEELAPYREAEGKRSEATEDRLRTETALADMKGTVDAAYANAYAQAARLHETQQAKLADERNNYVQDEMRRLNELAVTAQREVDPDAYWKERGGLAHALGIIGVALGSFGASMNGGVNTAYQMLQANMDRNIRAQEHNAAQAGKAFDIRSNLYAKNLEAFGDRERAIKATRINYLDSIGAQLDSVLADESKPLQQRQRAQQMKELVLKDRAGLTQEFMKLSHNQISLAQSDRFGAIGGGGGGPSAKPLANTITLADGTTYQVPEDVHKDTLTRVQAHTQLQDLDRQAKELRAKLAATNPVTDSGTYNTYASRLQKLAVDRINTESQAQGQGVVKREEMEQQLKLSPYMKGVGETAKGGAVQRYLNPLEKRDLTTGNNEIDAAIATSNQQQKALLSATGASLVNRGFAKDANGRLTPVGEHRGQYVQPSQLQAPEGFRPMDKSRITPTREAPTSETTPKAPVAK